MFHKKALLVIDMQTDFMPGGALAVPEANEIISGINQLLESPHYHYRLASKDAHPTDHVSFSKWPPHCLKGEKGADLVPELKKERFECVVEKGTLKAFDSYSAFYDAPNRLTRLSEFLKEKSVSDLYLCGVALEYCVKATAEDGLKQGFNVFLLKDFIKPIHKEEAHKVYADLKLKGAEVR